MCTKYCSFVFLLCLAHYMQAMENGMEDPAGRSWALGLQQFAPKDEIKHSWEGSREKDCCCIFSGCVSAFLGAHVLGCVTPSEERPLCNFLCDGMNPEHELLCSLVPLGIMFANATPKRADHSCCYGKLRLGARAAAAVCKNFLTMVQAERRELDDIEVGFYDDVPIVPMCCIERRRVPDVAKKRD